MVVVMIVAILAAIAMPSYERYIKKSRARGASADLMALTLNVENIFRRKLAYPAADESTTGTAATHALMPGWSPAMGEFFDYAASFEASRYLLTATGKTGMACTLELAIPHAGEATRTATGGDCGFSTW